jgi:hypothetical protein
MGLDDPFQIRKAIPVGLGFAPGLVKRSQLLARARFFIEMLR